MEWLEPIVKWVMLAAVLLGGLALQRTRARKVGATEEKLKQSEEANRAQKRQSKAMRVTRTRDLLDTLKRVRNKNRG